MSVLGWWWFLLSVVQLGAAAYAVAALLSWRGARLWPAPGRPLGTVSALVTGGLFVVAVVSLWQVRDVEFSRYVGTLSLMLASIALVAVLLARGERTD